MKVTWKRGLGICLALVLVVALGVYSSDHFLKATDGEENYIEDLTDEADEIAEAVTVPETEENELVQIESGELVDDLAEDLEWDDDEESEEVEETESPADDTAVDEEDSVEEKPDDEEVDADAIEAASADDEEEEETTSDTDTKASKNVNHYRLRAEQSSNITLYVTTGKGENGLTELKSGEEVVTTSTCTYFFVHVLEGYKAETTFLHSYAHGDASRTDYPTWTGKQYSIYMTIDDPDTNYIMPQQNAAIAAGCTYKFEYTGTTGKLANFWAEFAINGTPIEVKVAYDAGEAGDNVKNLPSDDGTYYHENVTEFSDHTITVSKTVPTAEGKTFVTWRGSDGKDYEPGSKISVKNIWNTIENDSNYKLTLTAIWDSSVSVSYDGNGNTNKGNLKDSNKYQVGDTATVLENTKWKRYNYEFVNWNTKADGSGTSYKAGDTIKLEKSITLYAQWKEKAKAVITYNCTEGGTVDLEKEILEPDDGDAIGSTATADSDDYIFVGWQDEDGNIVSTDPTYKPKRPSDGWGDGLTITAVFEKKPTVYIAAASETALYDGAVHQATGFTVNGVMEDTFTYKDKIYTIKGLSASSEAVKDAGSYPVTFTEKNFKIVDENEKDVTSQFKLDKTEGTLVISKRTIVMTSESATAEYDGNPLSATIVRITGDGFVNGEGATYAFLGTSQATKAGESVENKFKYSLNDNTNKSNYDITKEYGLLTLTTPVEKAKYVITISAKDESVYYNGKKQTPKGTIKETEFSIADKGIKLTVSGLSAAADPAKDAGSYPINIIGTAKVTDQNGNDVTDQCVINFESGTFTIKPRPILLTSDDVEQPYDGSPITGSTVTDSFDIETLESEAGFVPWDGIEEEEGFVGGDGADYTFTECITSGISYNGFTYTPKAGTNLSNYKIRVTRGRLTVTAPVTNTTRQTIELVPISKDVVYDGKEQSVSGFETTTFTIDGKTYEVTGIESSASGTEPGTYPTEYKGNPVVRDSEGNDVTDQFEVKIPNDGALKILGVYTLTINYVDAAGRTLSPSYRQSFAEGTVFAPIITPTIEGYTPQFSSVSCPDGGMPNRDITVNVAYIANVINTPTVDTTPADNSGTGDTTPADNSGTGDTTPADNSGTGDTTPADNSGTGDTTSADNNGTEETPADNNGTGDRIGTEENAATGTADNNGNNNNNGNAGNNGNNNNNNNNNNNAVNDNLIAVPTATVDTMTTTTIADEEAPKGVLTFDEDGNAAIVEIEDEATALAAGGDDGASWALVNLIASIATVITCIILLIAYLRSRKNNDKENNGQDSSRREASASTYEEEDEDEKKKSRNALRLGGLVPAIASVIIFFITEDMRNPMAYVDKWTILMIVLFLAELVLAIVSRKKKQDNDEGEARQNAQ